MFVILNYYNLPKHHMTKETKQKPNLITTTHLKPEGYYKIYDFIPFCELLRKTNAL